MLLALTRPAWSGIVVGSAALVVTLPISYRSDWREADGSCSRRSGGGSTSR